jgi:glutamate 5-kinase
MSTKIVAARLATSAGVTTVITRASSPTNIKKIVRYIQASRGSPLMRTYSEDSLDQGAQLTRSTSSLSLMEDKPPLHTRFLPDLEPIRDRHFWLLHGLAPHGTLYIDVGAYEALADKAGLLPAGVLDVEGNFGQHEAVRLVTVERRRTPNSDGKLYDLPGVEVGRALVNYAASEINRIKGHRSKDIEDLLGFTDSEYVAARQSISLYKKESRPVTPSLEFAQGAGPAMSIMDSIAAMTNGSISTSPR